MLRRAHRVVPLIESLKLSGADARPLFICSADDPEVLEAVRASGADNIVVDWPGGTPGDYARKINAGYLASDEPYLFTGADDLHFHEGWLDNALWHRPAHVIGTNDRYWTLDSLKKMKAWIQLNGSYELGPGPRQSQEKGPSDLPNWRYYWRLCKSQRGRKGTRSAL